MSCDSPSNLTIHGVGLQQGAKDFSALLAADPIEAKRRAKKRSLAGYHEHPQRNRRKVKRRRGRGI